MLVSAPVDFIRRLAPTPLLMVTGVDDDVHAVDEVLRAFDRASEPKRLELLQVDEYGLSIEPGLGASMDLAVGFFDEHLRRAPLFVPSPPPDQARERGLRPEYSDRHSTQSRRVQQPIHAGTTGDPRTTSEEKR